QLSIAAALDGTADGRPPLTIAVSDSGAGISDDMLPRVFDLFTQDDRAPQAAEDGLGIGLALARRLVDLHGGSIEGHSDGPGRGSTFTIRLPVAGGEPAPRPALSPAAAVRCSRRVVVINDNVQGANAMRRLVKALGGECRVAHDGEAGIEEVLTFRPDLVFVDIGMPGIDGYETCRRIRAPNGPGRPPGALTRMGGFAGKGAA